MISRKCPLCMNRKRVYLYNQRFSSQFSHKIVSCSNCNFIFVENIPSIKYYNDYYENQSKYEGVREHEVYEDQATEELVSFVKKELPFKSKILDVGCSTGYLLSTLKKFGYTNLSGIEPSSKCQKIAKKKYGLNIISTTLAEFKSLEKYDLVIISMVLEHLVKLKESIRKIKSLLNENGYVYIVVPDTSSFYLNTKEPFYEFSTEHINFFTESSLYLLMQGFRNIKMKSKDCNLFSIWQKGDPGIKSILKYIDISKTNLNILKKKIDSLPEKVIVWGAGALSQRLLSTTKIKDKILFFVDSNPKLQGTYLEDIPIYSPNIMINYHESILISSYNYSKEIKNIIKKKKYYNEIISFI